MTFDEILAQIIDLLQRQGRVSYRALKRRFDLPDEYLEDLKEEILYVHKSSVEADERGFMWTGNTADIQGTAASQPDRLSRSLLPNKPNPPMSTRRLLHLLCPMQRNAAN